MTEFLIRLMAAGFTLAFVWVFGGAWRERRRKSFRRLRMLAAIVLLASAVRAESPAHHHRMLRVSQVVLLAGNLADAGSSWGQPELGQPWLASNGVFAKRGFAIKIAVPLSFIFGENRALKVWPQAERPVVWGNFIGAAGFFGTAIHNHAVR